MEGSLVYNHMFIRIQNDETEYENENHIKYLSTMFKINALMGDDRGCVGLEVSTITLSWIIKFCTCSRDEPQTKQKYPRLKQQVNDMSKEE